ncbi:TetR/AcrR family transcriptional regulator [Mycobacterium sp. CBMA271]|uniref:TetR/AcrR family transcriptional regulator n=1 Tax=unclassified Mycobacteroides TaxID=2618759 RepID=UPI0012DF892A|nr:MULTISPECIES: TetR/AcrR family transcriptional regulator [unclassified Mycobacteroides]MUM19062.1 TetR family transcriptional regulator [Mycobacteroides sp. CBMA 326]MUM21475.1 TetR/AcrR family transcriptional regulator [Mycobacteroides sp. CBMA 271]
MAGGTKRLPRAVREQQMLDAAVEEFAITGFRDTSMDAIAAAAKISKPMLYLYYGSKEDLFVACLRRELGRFVEAVRGDIDLTRTPRDVLSATVVSFLNYVDMHRASWIVIYGQATSTQLFAKQVREGRDRIIELVARLIKAASPEIDPDTDYDAMAVALVGGGEAVASRVATGDIKVADAKETLLNLGWRGLRGRPRDDAPQAAKRA